MSQVAGGWSGGPTVHGSRTVVELFRSTARLHPEATAIRDGSRDVTYQELEVRSNRLAHWMAHENGVSPGDVVGLHFKTGWELVSAALAAMKCRAAFLGLDPEVPPGRLQEMLTDAGPALVLTDTAGVPGRVSPPAMAGTDPTQPAGDDVELRDAAYVIYTSGTTGRPKGVVIEHSSLANIALVGAQRLGLRPGVRMLQIASWTFDASVIEVFATLVAGATLVIGRTETLPDLLSDSSVDVAMLTPTVAAWLPVQPRLTVTTLALAGEKVPFSLLDRFSYVDRLINVYGPTEATICVTLHELDPQNGDVEVGPPLPGSRFYVLDEVGQPVPPGVEGELHIGGAVLARGYLNRPDLTDERFVPDPFRPSPDARMYKTGDRVTLDEFGVLRVMGRIDSQVKVRGVRIELQEIEERAREFDGVRDAGAALLNLSSGPAVGMLILEERSQPDDEPLVSAVDRHLRETLHPAMVPTVLRRAESLPKTASGKLNRDAVAEWLTSDSTPTRSTGQLTWRSAREREVAQVFADVGIQPTSRQETITTAGGHSLQAADIAARLNRRHGTALTMSQILRAGSVPRVAESLDDRANQPTEFTSTATTQYPCDLSAGERRLLFLWQLDPADASYCISMRMRLPDGTPKDEVVSAVRTVMARHETLYSRYVEQHENGSDTRGGVASAGPNRSATAKRRLIEPESIPVAHEDLTALRNPARELEKRFAESARIPFDLRQGPLARVQLFEVYADCYVVGIHVHHVAADGQSMSILADELRSQLENQSLPEAGAPYAHLAQLESARHTQARQDALLKFWEEEMEGVEPRLTVPGAEGSPSGPAESGVATRDLDARLRQAIEQTARRQDVTMFQLMLGLIGLHLGRLTGRDDLTVGGIVAERPTERLRETVGFFARTVPFRLRVDPRAPLDEHLRSVRATALRAMDHSDLPFEEIVRVVNPARTESQSPLLQVALNVLNYEERDETRPDGARIFDRTPSKLDMTLYVQALSDGRLRLRWNYSRWAFGARFMAEFAEQFVSLLHQATSHVDRPLWAYELSSPGRQRLAASLATQRPSRTPTHEVATVGGRRPQEAPRAPALSGSASCTYGELEGLVAELETAFRERIPPRRAVAVIAGREAVLPVAALAALRARRPFCLIDAKTPEARMRRILESLAPAVVISTHEVEAPGAGTFLLSGRGKLRDIRQEASRRDVSRWTVLPESASFITATSGTTGEPKLVIGRESALARQVQWETEELGLTVPKTALTSSINNDPVYRDILVPLCTGGTLVLPPDGTIDDPAAYASFLRREEIELWHTTPMVARAVGQALGQASRAMRAVLVGGDVLRAQDVRALSASFPNARVLNVYGTTETPQVMSFFEAHPADLPAGPVPLGAGTSSSQLAVIEEHGRRLCGVGEIGRVAVVSPYVADGYLNGLDQGGFTSDVAGLKGRAYVTGDFGWHDVNGAVHFHSRADGMMNINGVRVHSAEVQRSIAAHPAVVEAAAADAAIPLGDPGTAADGEDRTAMKVFVVLEDPSRATAELLLDIARTARASLPSGIHPTAIPVRTLRFGASGKLSLELTSQEVIEVRPVLEDDQPDRVRDAVDSAWERLLGRSPRHGTESFFDAGGHSLLATRLISALHASTGVQIALGDLLREPTPSEIARRLRAGCATTGQVGAGGDAVDG